MTCLVEKNGVETHVNSEFGSAAVTVTERTTINDNQAGFATLRTCAILNSILEAKNLGAKMGETIKFEEFCRECMKLVSGTLTLEN
jgi:hypothetical protein